MFQNHSGWIAGVETPGCSLGMHTTAGVDAVLEFQELGRRIWKEASLGEVLSTCAETPASRCEVAWLSHS